ncbi:hypothetical protein BDC45DRAFT_583445 [Circinella umbellata]|nr:hypothetical protein BDC45DRAFT_583445 [Circinella umbellata]
MFRHMELNMFIESFHNQLKTVYLQRRGNRRIDGLIFLLISKVHKRIVRRIKAETNRIGRMGPLALARRERQMKAEAYTLEQLDMMIELKEDGHQIQSFTDINIYYMVTSDDTFITSCTCADFAITQYACKYMYAIELSEPELSVRLPHHSSIANVLEDDVNSNLTEETAVIINANTSFTPVV